MNLPEYFSYQNGQLYIEECSLQDLAQKYGTPLYVYTENAIQAAYQRYASGFEEAGLKATICYAVKANSNLAILGKLVGWGAGADIVSGGDLYRVRRAGIAPEKIVFAGVGKTQAEIDYALGEGILALNVESSGEFDLIEQRAASLGKPAAISLRVRPGIEPDTHHYITTGAEDNKFGLAIPQALDLAKRAAKSPHLILQGLHAHIGSQMQEASFLLESTGKLVELATILKNEGIELSYLDIGGGVGVDYTLENPPAITPAQLAQGIAAIFGEVGCSYPLIIEPGRSLVAMAGALVTQVLYLKESFAIVDAGMNDLIRPALYEAYHPVLPVKQAHAEAKPTNYKVVGPVCESADFLSQKANLPELKAGDWLAVLGAGAYGFSMASNYNSRLRPAEMLVAGKQATLIRRRQTFEDLCKEEE